MLQRDNAHIAASDTPVQTASIAGLIVIVVVVLILLDNTITFTTPSNGKSFVRAVVENITVVNRIEPFIRLVHYIRPWEEEKDIRRL